MPRKKGPKKIQKKSEKFGKQSLVQDDDDVPEIEMVDLEDVALEAEKEPLLPSESNEEDF